MKEVIKAGLREAVDVSDFPAHVTHSQYISHGSGADLIPSVQWICKAMSGINACSLVNSMAGAGGGIHIHIN